MAEEAEKLALRILQEMRSKLDEIDVKITDLTQRVDGNTLTFNLVVGVTYDQEQRIALLEGRGTPRR